MAIATAKLTETFQITIPAEVRQKLGLKVGDMVSLAIEEGRVVLQRAREADISRGLGSELWREVGGGASAIEQERDSWE